MSIQNPSIPALLAEKLYVTLGVTVQEIARQSDYPVDVLEKILAEYRADVDAHLSAKGWDAEDIKAVTSQALNELNALHERRGADSVGEDFDLWRLELGEVSE